VTDPKNHANPIWSVADLLRGDYKQSEYGKVILPLTVIRRLDCVLEPTKEAVLDRYAQLASRIENLEPVLQAVSGEQFLQHERAHVHEAARRSEQCGSAQPLRRRVLCGCQGRDRQGRLRDPDRASASSEPALPSRREVRRDLPDPDKVSNIEMGYLYEELIRKFSELSN
jgi:type I restriction enzyme M protein